jgi:hypothetical protein
VLISVENPGSGLFGKVRSEPGIIILDQVLDQIRPFDIIAIYGPVIFYGPVRNAFDADKSITRASGRGVGPGNRDFFGPCEMASSR